MDAFSLGGWKRHVLLQKKYSGTRVGLAYNALILLITSLKNRVRALPVGLEIRLFQAEKMRNFALGSE